MLPPEPASFGDLLRVHDGVYIDSLLQPGSLVRILGSQVPDRVQETFIAAQRAMVGGTLLATRRALKTGGVVASLGGGLHHAFRDRGERFCLFNDVAAAIAAERERGLDAPVLVVDLDLHDADGTRSLLAADPAAHLFTIQNRSDPDTATPNSTSLDLGSGVGDRDYLEAIRTHLPPLVARLEPRLVVYLAGADPAHDDEIGDWQITEQGMFERDRFVHDLVRGAPKDGGRIPLVVLLAGGYGQRAWRYAARYLAWALTGEEREPPSTEEVTLLRYRKLARRLGSFELSGEEPGDLRGDLGGDLGLSEEDLAIGLGGPRRPRRLLGFYSPQGLELALERAGILDRLRKRGYPRPTVELELENPAGDTLRLFGDERTTELLAEARVRIDRGTAPGFAFLRIESLQLQDPRAPFTAERPALPGQRYPGLGMLADAVALMILACDRLGLDGVVFVPSHYHLAGQGRQAARFLDPADEGRFRALEAALAGLPLAAATRAVHEGRVVDAATGGPVAFRPAPMVIPVSERLREKVAGDEYEAAAKAAAGGYRLALRPE